jgi:hypothetical protein
MLLPFFLAQFPALPAAHFPENPRFWLLGLELCQFVRFLLILLGFGYDVDLLGCCFGGRLDAIFLQEI